MPTIVSSAPLYRPIPELDSIPTPKPSSIEESTSSAPFANLAPESTSSLSYYALIAQISGLIKTLSEMSSVQLDQLMQEVKDSRRLTEDQITWMNRQAFLMLGASLIGGGTAIGSAFASDTVAKSLIAASKGLSQLGQAAQVACQGPTTRIENARNMLDRVTLAKTQEAGQNVDTAVRNTFDVISKIAQARSRGA